MTNGYYIKIGDAYWTGGFEGGHALITLKESRAKRFSSRIVAEQALEDVQQIQPVAVLSVHLANKDEKL
jgi:hypothetical protein